MSIRDIIEAAKVCDEHDRCDGPDGCPAWQEPNKCFAWLCAYMKDYSAFAREIVAERTKYDALVEAERVAAREFITDRASGVGFAVRKYDAWVDACEATDAYRKERGL